MTNGAAVLFMPTAYQNAAIYFGDTPLVSIDSDGRVAPRAEAVRSWLGTLRAIASGDSVDRDGNQQHQRRDDVLRGGAEAQQAHAVVDRGDHDAADDAVHGLPSATEQACAADDGCCDRVQDQGAAVQCGGDGAQP